MNAALSNLYRQAEDYFFRGISSQCLSLSSEANLYMTEVSVANLNLVYIQNNTNNLEFILRQSQEFYKQNNLAFDIIIPQDFCQPEIENCLIEKDFSFTGSSTSMAIALEEQQDYRPKFDDEISILAASNKLNDWMLPLIGAFESSFEICSQYLQAHERALPKD